MRRRGRALALVTVAATLGVAAIFAAFPLVSVAPVAAMAPIQDQEEPDQQAASAGEAPEGRESAPTGALAALDPLPTPLGPPARRQWKLAVRGPELLLTDEGGEEILRIPARLDAQYGVRAGLAGTWTIEGPGRAVALAENDFVRALFSVTSRPDQPFVEARIDLEYLDDVEVDHEVWTFTPLGLKGQVLDRGYEWKKLRAAPVFIDRWTPRVAQLTSPRGPAFAFIADDTFEGLRIGTTAIHWELDHAGNHPHTVYRRCFPKYAPNRDVKSISRRLRQLGEKATYRVTFVAGKAQVPVLRRWPEDRKAAMVFVDHADKSNADALGALLYGDSSGKDRERGMLGNGLTMTRTVFDSPEQLQDPDFRALVDEFAKRGGEVAPHSITPWPEDAAQIREGLETAFAPFSPRTWVDHQPDTNCEAINNRGGQRGAAHNVVDVLYGAGVRYLWEAPDPDYHGQLNLLRPQRSRSRAAFLYPAPSLSGPDSDAEPWLFQTAWMFVPRAKFLRRFSTKKLDQLEDEHGVHLAHTYLAASHLVARHRANSIFKRQRGGGVETRAEFEGLWTRLGKRHRAKRLWVTTVRDLGDWLTAWRGVRATITSPTSLRLAHDGTKSVGGVPQSGYTLAAAALPDGSTGRVAGRKRVTVALDEELEVSPAMFDADVGVTLEVEGDLLAAGSGAGYAAGRQAMILHAEARRLGAPGVDVEIPCLEKNADGTCARGGLDTFFAGLDALVGIGEAPKRTVRVVVLGNSLIASDRVIDVTRRRLQARFGDGGRGIVYVDSLKFFGRRAWTGKASKGWYVEYLTQYLGKRPAAAYPLGLTGGHHVSFKKGAKTTWRTGSATSADIFWLDHERAPPLRVIVDNELLTEVQPARDGQPRTTRVQLPPGSKRLTLEAPERRAVVYGATLERPEPGVVVDTVGIVAASANSYLKIDEDVFRAQLEARDPSLIVWQLGGNEARRIDRGVFTEQQVRDDLERLLTRMRTVAPDVPCLTVGPIETVFVHTPRSKPFVTRPYIEYVVELERELSLAAGCAYIDLFQAMGGLGSMKRFDDAGLVSRDRIHPKGTGLDVLGQLLADALLRGYAQGGDQDARAAALAAVPDAHAPPRLSSKAPVEGELMAKRRARRKASDKAR